MGGKGWRTGVRGAGTEERTGISGQAQRGGKEHGAGGRGHVAEDRMTGGADTVMVGREHAEGWQVTGGTGRDMRGRQGSKRLASGHLSLVAAYPTIAAGE